MKLIKFYGHWINPLSIEGVSRYGDTACIIHFSSGWSLEISDSIDTVIKSLAQRASQPLALPLWD